MRERGLKPKGFQGEGAVWLRACPPPPTGAAGPHPFKTPAGCPPLSPLSCWVLEIHTAGSYTILGPDPERVGHWGFKEFWALASWRDGLAQGDRCSGWGRKTPKEVWPPQWGVGFRLEARVQRGGGSRSDLCLHHPTGPFQALRAPEAPGRCWLHHRSWGGDRRCDHSGGGVITAPGGSWT